MDDCLVRRTSSQIFEDEVHRRFTDSTHGACSGEQSLSRLSPAGHDGAGGLLHNRHTRLGYRAMKLAMLVRDDGFHRWNDREDAWKPKFGQQQGS